MAYEFTILDRFSEQTPGGLVHTVVLRETDAEPSSRWKVAGLPRVGRLTFYDAHITAGSGATLLPRLGYTDGWTANTREEVARQGAAAASVRDMSVVVYDSQPFDAGTFYGESGVDAGADTVILTTFSVTAGHI